LRVVSGAAAAPTYRRAWIERPRGHGKSLDLGIMATWALFASPRRISGIGAAVDRDQARLLRDAISRLVFVNPWLREVLEAQTYRVVNRRTESTLEIIASDAPSSYGATPDFVIADEVANWPTRDLWDSLLSSAAKRSTCLLTVITNAGVQSDWQWPAREAIRQDPSWYFSRQEGPVASWIRPDIIAEQQRHLPEIVFRKLWSNQWTAGVGAALTPEDIEACITLEGPLTVRDPQLTYYGGVDLSTTRDHSSVVVVGYDGRHTRLVRVLDWAPPRGGVIDLRRVRAALEDLDKRFGFRRLLLDPHQGMLLMQDLAWGLRVEPVVFSPTNLTEMCSALLESVHDGVLHLYRDKGLIDDLYALRLVDRGVTYKLDSVRSSAGHGDRATALVLALLGVRRYPARPATYASEQDMDDLEESRNNRSRESAAAAHSLYGTGASVYSSNALRRQLYGVGHNPYRSRWSMRD
jgi:hypothetical protein